jgi:DnaJ-class molecular chaperone
METDKLVIAQQNICTWCEGTGREIGKNGIISCLHCDGYGSSITVIDGGEIREKMLQQLTKI